MENTDSYRNILTRLRDYLASYGDTKWKGRIEDWLQELDSIASIHALRSHLERSQRATGGMGSLGDLTICPQNGHSIRNDRTAISEASSGLWGLTSELYRVTSEQLAGLRDR